MRLGIDRGSFLIGLGLGGLLAFLSSVPFAAAAPGKPAAVAKPTAKLRANAIGGGDVTLPCNLNLKAVLVADSGATNVQIDVDLGGGHKQKAISVSPDGTTFAIEGGTRVPVTSPPPAMVTMGNALSQLQSRLTAAVSAPGVAALLCAP
jgi:hypothetical protein